MSQPSKMSSTITPRGAKVALLRGTIASAARFVWHGDGAASDRVPGDGVRYAWGAWWQVSLTCLFIGLAGWQLADPGLIASAAAFVGVAGFFFLLLGLFGYASVAGSRPSPAYFAPVREDLEPSDVEGRLVAFRDGVWVASVPLLFEGAPFGTRMTVLDTGSGLLVVSPIKATPAWVEAVRALGEVRWILAPNALHHLFVAGWLEAFPHAELWAAPGLADFRDDLSWTGTLLRAQDAPWPADRVAVAVLDGHPWHREVVVFHRPSSTLVAADMIENFGHDLHGISAPMRAVLALMGMMRRPGPPTDWKLSVTDRVAVARFAETVAAWEPSAILLAHGAPIEQEATAVWRAAFAFVTAS